MAPIFAYLLFLSPNIQTYVCKEIAKDISRTSNSPVSIESVDISLFKSVIISGLTISDQQQDTIIYIKKLESYIDSVKFSQKRIYINTLSLDEVYMRYYEVKRGVSNLDIFVDALSSSKEKQDSIDSQSWFLNINNISLSKSRFAYKTYQAKPQEYGMNYDDIYVSDLNLKIQNIKYTGDSLKYYLSDFSCKEKCGFRIKKFRGKQWITNKQWGLTGVSVESEHSTAKASLLTFNYTPGEDSWSKFITRMRIDYRVSSSTVNFIDISYFNDILEGYKELAHVSGRIYGTINNLKGRDIHVKYGKNTVLKANFFANGLPEIFDTYLEASIEELSTDFSDIEKIYLPHYSKRHIILPSKFKDVGQFSYKGKFNGFLNDFVCYGKIQTRAGILKTDILFKPQTKTNGLVFKGDLSSSDFDLGKLFSQKNIGGSSFNIYMRGLYKPEGTYGAISGTVHKINIFDYDYKNILLDGVFSNNFFNGMMSIKDPNIDFSFKGKVDLSSQIPKLNFSSSLKNANLYALKLNTNDNKSKLSFDIKSNFTGSGPENANGTIDLNRIYYTNKIGHIDLDSLKLEAKTNPDHKELKLTSKVIAAYIKGNYNINKLPKSLQSIFKSYLPSYYADEKVQYTDSINNFSFGVNVLNTDSITKILLPKFSIAKNSKIEGNIDTKNKDFGLSFETDEITYEERKIKKIKIKVKSTDKNAFIKTSAGKINLASDYYLYNFNNNISIDKDRISSDVMWSNWKDKTYSGFLSSVANISKSEQGRTSWLIDINPSNIIMADSVWNIKKSDISIDSSSIHINNFVIKKYNEEFKINGLISESPEDSLKVEIINFNIANINSVLSSDKLSVNGEINGNLILNDYYGEKRLFSKLNVNQFSVNKDTIGNLHLFTNWDYEKQKLNITSILKHKNKEEIKINGNYKPYNNNIDLNVKLDRFKLKSLELYFADNISEVKGSCSGNIKVHGDVNEPIFNGNIHFSDAKIKVNRLQTSYSFKDSIFISPNNVYIPNFRIYDSNNNTATIQGGVSHENFNNIKYDLSVNYNKFKSLNTRNNDIDPAYGHIYLSGSTHLYGDNSIMNIDVNAKTEKNSRIFMALDFNSDIKEKQFITFINKSLISTNTSAKAHKSTGYKLNCDIEVNPDTEIQIILNSKIGDILKTNGRGIMNISMNPKGDFKMLGEYTIKKGSYLFTLQDVINKKFKIEDGGYIKWNGDPYNADININAIYNIKTSIHELMLNSNNIDSKRKIPVQCKIHLNDKLLNPKIKFGIDFPTIDQQTQSLLQGLFINDDEVNKQILSLLVLNKFYTPEYLRSSDEYNSSSGGNAVGITSSELLSNQLSNWLSQISNDFDIGINYRPGDEISTDEIELALSTQMFNNKVTINGNVATGRYQSQANNIVGDADINIQLDKKGKLQLKAFTRANEYLLYENTRNTQGIGIFYKEDFDNLKELFTKYINLIRRKKKQQ